jgi:hypothetical protein
VFQEADRAFGLATLLPSGMARISLAMGTAFAVLCFSRSSKDGLGPATVAAVLAFAGGILGSGVASRFGQRARSRVLAERGAWKRAFAAAVRELGSESSSGER